MFLELLVAFCSLLILLLVASFLLLRWVCESKMKGAELSFLVCFSGKYASPGQIASGTAKLESHEDVEHHYVDLLVIIPSSVTEWDKRLAIRQSWGKYIDSSGHCKKCNSNRTIKVLFGVARPGEDNAHMIETEMGSFQDLAVLHLNGQADHYRNLTSKVRSFIEYALHNFRFGLLLKVDTDSFVFMDRFLSMAEQKKLFDPNFNSTNIYGGAFQNDARPDENPAGKWVDRTYRKLTGHNLFPKYARGAGYVLSPSLCRYIAEGLPDDLLDHQGDRDSIMHTLWRLIQNIPESNTVRLGLTDLSSLMLFMSVWLCLTPLEAPLSLLMLSHDFQAEVVHGLIFLSCSSYQTKTFQWAFGWNLLSMRRRGSEDRE